jgi:hypothetical protein
VDTIKKIRNKSVMDIMLSPQDGRVGHRHPIDSGEPNARKQKPSASTPAVQHNQAILVRQTTSVSRCQMVINSFYS